MLFKCTTCNRQQYVVKKQIQDAKMLKNSVILWLILVKIVAYDNFEERPGVY